MPITYYIFSTVKVLTKSSVMNNIMKLLAKNTVKPSCRHPATLVFPPLYYDAWTKRPTSLRPQ